MEFVEFLRQASSEEFLTQVRTEVQPRAASQEANYASDSDDSVSSRNERKGKPVRQPSQSVIALVHKFFPDVDCSNDTKCVRMAIEATIPYWHQLFADDTEQYKRHLQCLQKLIKNMQPNIQTQRTEFTFFTKMFKNFYVVRKGEDVRTGPFIKLIRSVLKADENDVSEYISVKEERLETHLNDKFVEVYEDVAGKVTTMYTFGMQNLPSAVAVASLILAIMASCGCRRGEVLDPSVTFEPYNRTGGAFHLGNQDKLEDENVRVSETAFGETIGFTNVIVQTGIFKDRNQRMNQFVKPDDDRFTPHRAVVKVTIILTAQQIVDAVNAIRTSNNITIANYPGRIQMDKVWPSSLFTPLLKKYFPNAVQKAKLHGWPLNTHYLRKFYSNASFALYEERIRQFTNRHIDKSVWSRKILAHEGSLATSLSYANVVVEFQLPVGALKTMPCDLVRKNQAEVLSLQQRIEDLEAKINQMNQCQSISKPAFRLQNQVSFEQNGRMVCIPKYHRRMYQNNDERFSAVKDAIEQLRNNEIQVTPTNLLKLGFGTKTLREFRQKHGDALLEPMRKRNTTHHPSSVNWSYETDDDEAPEWQQEEEAREEGKKEKGKKEEGVENQETVENSMIRELTLHPRKRLRMPQSEYVF